MTIMPFNIKAEIILDQGQCKSDFG